LCDGQRNRHRVAWYAVFAWGSIAGIAYVCAALVNRMCRLWVPVALFLVGMTAAVSRGQDPETDSSFRKICEVKQSAAPTEQPRSAQHECVVPQDLVIDSTFRQKVFVCCGGEHSSPTRAKDIPPGILLRTSGEHYWAVSHPELQDPGGLDEQGKPVRKFIIWLYCGPSKRPNGQGCSVKVEVFAKVRRSPRRS
jgi:hypothetical protein